MFTIINSKSDIKHFLDKTNNLHDGYIISVRYDNNGISKIENGYLFSHEKTKLVIQILVTSIYDTIVELEFENLSEWQIRDNQWEFTDTAVWFDEQNFIVWSDDNVLEEFKSGSYVIAKSMKWRIVE
jgi:hypothetical protein